MNKPIDEIKKMQLIAGLINEVEYNEFLWGLNKQSLNESETKEAKKDEAVKAEVKAKAPSTKKPTSLHIDQANPYEYRHGIAHELNELGEYTNEALEKAKTTVLKNLAKDANFYSNLLNQQQSSYKFKASETDKPGYQARPDGNLKKEAKKDEKSNVKDNLGKKEAGKLKPKGVKIMPDKGVEGKEKTIKEGFQKYYHILQYDGNDVGYHGYYDTPEEAEKEADSLSNMFSDSNFQIWPSNSSNEPEVVTTGPDIPYDRDDYAIQENAAVDIENAIRDGKIKPEEVKAAAEKAMKGDSTSLIALMTGIPGLSLSEDTVEEDFMPGVDLGGSFEKMKQQSEPSLKWNTMTSQNWDSMSHEQKVDALKKNKFVGNKPEEWYNRAAEYSFDELTDKDSVARKELGIPPYASLLQGFNFPMKEQDKHAKLKEVLKQKVKEIIYKKTGVGGKDDIVVASSPIFRSELTKRGYKAIPGTEDTTGLK